MTAAIPPIEITDDADAPGVGRPNAEADAGDPIDDAQLGAELVVNAPLVTLAEQVKIGFAEGWEKRIRIANAADAAMIVGDGELVRIYLSDLFGDSFKESSFVQSFQLDGWLILVVDRERFRFRRIGKEGAHDHAGAVSQRVHAQQLVRVGIICLDQALQFSAAQNHTARSLPDHLRKVITKLFPAAAFRHHRKFGAGAEEANVKLHEEIRLAKDYRNIVGSAPC